MHENIASWLENILGMPVEAYFEQNIVQNEELLIGYHDNPEGAIRTLESSCELENVA